MRVHTKFRAMQQEIVIRDYKDFEAAEVYAIIRHIYLSSDFMCDDFDRRFNTVAAFKSHYDNLLRQPGSFLMVALAGNRPVGYLLLEGRQEVKLRHTAWLSMGMIEGFRRKGFGSQLVEAAVDRAQNEDHTEIIYLMVRADHTGAIRLYEKTGFEALTILERDTRIGNEYYDGVLMRRFVK